MNKSANKPSFEHAKREYPHRYTCEHVPAWAYQPVQMWPPGVDRRKTAPTIRWYAPQYRTDREWYDNTTFPEQERYLSPEERTTGKRYCFSTGRTWPLGQWLDAQPAPMTWRT